MVKTKSNENLTGKIVNVKLQKVQDLELFGDLT
jgi:hypothetical protein